MNHEAAPPNEPIIDRPPVNADLAPPTVDAEGVPQTRLGRFRLPTESLRAYTMLFALITIWLYFQWATIDETHPYGLFLGAINFSKLLQQTVVTGVLAVGMLMVIVAAQIDLSVGSVVGLAGGIAAMAQRWGVVLPLSDITDSTFMRLPLVPTLIGLSVVALVLFVAAVKLKLERRWSLRLLAVIAVAAAIGVAAFFAANAALKSYGSTSISVGPAVVTGSVVGLIAGIIASLVLRRGSWNILLERGWKQPSLALAVGAIGLIIGLATGLLGSKLIERLGWGDWGGWLLILSLGSAIVVGLVIGAVQGSLVAYVSIPAFIVTLGGLLAWRGVILWRMKGEAIPVELPVFQSIGNGFIAPIGGIVLAAIAIAAIAWLNLRRLSRARRQQNADAPSLVATLLRIIIPSAVIILFVYMMNTQVGVPIPVFIFLAVAVMGAFLTQNTTFGRYLYAVGGNPDAARLSGISLRRHILAAFCIMGALAGLASLIYTSRTGTAAADAGNLMELDAIAACVIGGTSLMGGRGTVFGACLGALIMASLNNGMSLLNIQNHWQLIVKGAVLVAAVGFDMLGRKRG